MALPYPTATSDAVSRVMRANRKTGSSPEVRLRAALHRRGLRFRKNRPIVVGSITVTPDIVFSSARVAVFVDGCFWHRCPEHATTPRSNGSYWLPKLDRNVDRDERANKALADHGWAVVRVWEHQTIAELGAIAADVCTFVTARRASR